jgi:hypothetical protein
MSRERQDRAAEGDSAGDDVDVAPAPGKQTQVMHADITMGIPSHGRAPRKPPAGGPDLTVHPKEPALVSQQVEDFRNALNRKDRATAEHAWSMLSDAERRGFGGSPTISDDLKTVVRVLGGMTVPIMAQAGVDFAGRGDLIELILQVGMPHWFDGLDIYGGSLLSTFLDHLPARDKLDDAALKKLQRLMRGTNSLALARPLFERIYVPVSDTTYNAAKLRTAPWKADQIHRLYDVLSKHLPVAHVRAINAFYLGRDRKDGTQWKTLTYGWWTHSGNVVLPEKSAKTGGHLDHNMTGGGKAQADPKTDKGKTDGTMNHFDTSALHEVGHAVGGRLGGHDWADKHPFVDWRTKLEADAWSKKLWGDDATLTARATRKADGGKVLQASDARIYMATSISGAATLPARWTADEVEEALVQQYADQPLTKYWQEHELVNDASKTYKFTGNANYGSDGRVYVWLSRGDSGFSSYTQEAHKKKVSWYSLASPHEWFAEQYAHYYRGSKLGAGLDAGTKTKLDELDKQTPADHELLKPGDGGDGAVEDAAGARDDDEMTGRRLPFPW